MDRRWIGERLKLEGECKFAEKTLFCFWKYNAATSTTSQDTAGGEGARLTETTSRRHSVCAQATLCFLVGSHRCISCHQGSPLRSAWLITAVATEHSLRKRFGMYAHIHPVPVRAHIPMLFLAGRTHRGSARHQSGCESRVVRE